MVDWHDTQAFFREHWRPILIVSMVVVAIVVAISLTLVFVLRRKPEPSASVPPFNGPMDINGDPSQNSNIFAYPQIILNPLPGSEYFGANLYVHEAGYLAATYLRPDGHQSLLFYYTDLSGSIQGPQEIVLDFLTPLGYKVCNGTFAPIFNTAGEVYYLFVSVGPVGATGNLYPVNVLLFTLDTAATSNVWQLSDINTTYTTTLGSVKAMKLPNANFTWNAGPNASKPWYGTFGAKIQVVLDDNEAIVKQSLYISGSEFDPNLPGGNLYWFVLQDNTASPNVALLYTIQDAKLLLMHQQANCPTGCDTCTGSCLTFDATSEIACTNGFASDFYVTSGNKANNILVVANSTPQDNCVLTGTDQPCAPKGYVQGYLLNSQGGTQSWVQPMASGSNTFLYRYIGAVGDPNILGGATSFGGFANSVSVVGGKLFVGQGEPNASGNASFLVFDWTPNPFSGGKLSPIGTLNPASEAPSASFPLTGLYPVSPAGLRYNQGVQLVDDGSNQLLATSWYYPGPGDVISLQDVAGTTDPYSQFSLVQTLGASYSSQTPTSLEQGLVGFAQNTATWVSRTGASVRMAFNDPAHNHNAGRLVVLTRKRQG